ncbi:MAG: radical SAM protein [Candidatus Aenigmatarchaeota archaeon]
MKKTRILLINPNYTSVGGKLRWTIWHTPPLGLAYIAAILVQEGFEVKILDLNVESKSPLRICEEFKPNIVGITCTTPVLKSTNDLCKNIKNNFPEIITVVGGAHPSSMPKDMLVNNKSIDFIVIGEGEFTTLEIAENVENENKNFSKIKGIAFREGEKIIITKSRELISNLDSLPFPARELLPIRKYNSHICSLKEPEMSIITSRGCPYNCIFCCKKIFGRVFRARSACNVVDEIEHLVNRYRAREITIVDDNFTLDKERTIEICKEIIQRELDISWFTPNGIRADALDEERIKWMKKSGCHLLFFGVESGSQRIINKIKKGINLKQIENVVELCRKYEIDVGLFFMIGLPNEKEEDIKKTILFAKKLNPDIAKFGITVPFPGTSLFEELDKKGFIKNYNFEDYSLHSQPVFETEYLSSDEIMKFYKKAYREFYLDLRHNLRQFSKIRSFTELKKKIIAAGAIIWNQLT